MMRNLITLLLIAFAFSLNAQMIMTPDDCLCGKSTVYSPPTDELITTKQARKTYTITQGQEAEYKTITYDKIIKEEGVAYNDPKCPVCATKVPAITKTVTEEVLVKEAIPPTIVVTVIPAEHDIVSVENKLYDAEIIKVSGGECGVGKTEPVRGAQSFEVTGENLQVTPVKKN